MGEIELCARPPRSPALRGVVERFWYMSDAARHGAEIKLPTPTAQILVNLDAERLSTRPCGTGGTATAGAVGLSPIAQQAVMLDRSEQRRIAGVVIRPEAVGALAQTSAEGLGPLVGLDGFGGLDSAAERLRAAAVAGSTGEEALNRLEGALAAMIGGRVEADRSCRAAIAHLRCGVPVGEVADRVGLSQSALTRRFRTATGMTAKRYQRLLRLGKAVDLAAGRQAPDWAEIAVGCGCYDQAHLAHEFAELAGLSPTRWHRSVSADPFHVPLPTADFLQDAPSGGRHDHGHG